MIIITKIKTIRVMLQEMGEQQQAVFRMAFKMHNTTNYVIVSPSSDERPDLVLVDTDTPAGVEAWKSRRKLIRKCLWQCFLLNCQP